VVERWYLVSKLSLSHTRLAAEMSSKLKSDGATVCGWCHLVNAMDVTAGLVKSNGSLPLGGWLKSHLQAEGLNIGISSGPMLSNEYGRTLPFTCVLTGLNCLWNRLCQK